MMDTYISTKFGANSLYGVAWNEVLLKGNLRSCHDIAVQYHEKELK